MQAEFAEVGLGGGLAVVRVAGATAVLRLLAPVVQGAPWRGGRAADVDVLGVGSLRGRHQAGGVWPVGAIADAA